MMWADGEGSVEILWTKEVCNHKIKYERNTQSKGQLIVKWKAVLSITFLKSSGQNKPKADIVSFHA